RKHENTKKTCWLTAVGPRRNFLAMKNFLAAAAVALLIGIAPRAQTGTPGDATFSKDIAPILQRSCQQCHRADGVAPMALVTYDDVRPWAKAIKMRTSLGPHAGVMPPWFVEKDIGIQHYKYDPSLSDAEIAAIAAWVDGGAVRGNPDDMPPPRKVTTGEHGWLLGT